MAKKILNDLFSSLENSLISDMDICIQHNLEDGKYREYLVKNILSKIIPKKYSVTNGFIIDSDNNKTEEMDIIVYDSNYVPPFFDETYTIVPIESVVAVIQVKTNLTKKQLKNAVDNVNSIDNLNSKTGGKIISANGKEIIENRNIRPYKIIVSKTSDISKSYKFEKEMESVDIIYIVDESYNLIIKNKKNEGIVNENSDEIKVYQNKDVKINYYYDNKLCIFSLMLLEKLKLINNSIIINYQEYLKGVINYED